MSVPAGEGFPKRVRLRKRREFLAVQRSSRRLTTASFVVYVRANGGRPTRLGITVSRKVGKAHLRNRIKRWTREAFRRNRSSLPGGLDVVLVAKNDAIPQGYDDVRAQLLQTAERLKGPPPPRRPQSGRNGR